jgi:glucokinase
MSSDKPLFIGMDLGGTNIQSGVVDASGQVLARDKTKTKAEEGADKILKRLEKAVGKLLEEADCKSKDITALGIGAPGAIDVANGVVYNAPNLGWRDFPLADRLGEQLGIRVVVDNDVNVGTWGEACAGAGRGCDDLMGVFVGTGIGAGIVLGGRLYHGARRTAGEIGHTVLKPDAPIDQQTLENLASRRAIGHRLAKLIQSGRSSLIDELSDGGKQKVKSKMLAEAWNKEDPLTREVVSEAAEYVGIAVANVVTLLSLPRVVLGGGLSEAMGEQWTGQVRAAFQQHVFPQELSDSEILTGELGDDAGIVGAAALARQQTSLDAAGASC